MRKPFPLALARLHQTPRCLQTQFRLRRCPWSSARWRHQFRMWRLRWYPQTRRYPRRTRSLLQGGTKNRGRPSDDENSYEVASVPPHGQERKQVEIGEGMLARPASLGPECVSLPKARGTRGSNGCSATRCHAERNKVPALARPSEKPERLLVQLRRIADRRRLDVADVLLRERLDLRRRDRADPCRAAPSPSGNRPRRTRRRPGTPPDPRWSRCPADSRSRTSISRSRGPSARELVWRRLTSSSITFMVVFGSTAVV